MNDTEKKWKEMMEQELPVSDEVNQSLQQVYNKIRSGEVKMKQSGHRIGRYTRAASVAAAALIVGTGVFFTSHPTSAAGIPIIGHIFETVSDKASYPGDYTTVAKPLVPEATSAESEATIPADSMSETASTYTCYSDGLTITLSEIYCSDAALYLTMQLQADEPFPDTFVDQFQTQSLLAEVSSVYSYNEKPVMDGIYLDGKMLDDKTYVGILRFDLQYTTKADIPDDFQVQMTIDKIIGDLANPQTIFDVTGEAPLTDEEIDHMTEEEIHQHSLDLLSKAPEFNQFPNKYENYWYEGPFTFDLDVHVDQEHAVTVPVDPESDQFYIDSVTKTPFELQVNTKNEIEDDWYTLVVLDADGKKLEYGNTTTDFVVGDHNLEHIDIYYMSWDDFESTSVKGSYFDTHDTNEEGLTLKEALEKYSVYHKTVTLP